MYPATLFRVHDNSAIANTVAPNVIDDSPLFLQVFSCDKGTEDLIEISGSANFDNMYGVQNFAKHGQAGIQAKGIVDAGGRLLAKRVVAEDSTLANLVLVATVTEGTPSDNGSGSGSEEPTVKVSWSAQSIENCKTFDEVKAKAFDEIYDEANGVYPLIFYTDNGRGESIKAVRLNPDYDTSRTIGTIFYTIAVYEGTNIVEKKAISLDPKVVYKGVAYALDKFTMTQIVGEIPETMFELFLNKVSTILGQDPDVLRTYDLVNGYTFAGKEIPGYIVDNEGVDPDAATGLGLTKGSNGSFGAAPVGTDALKQALVEVFNGTFSQKIFDVDEYKVSAVFDANYPIEVKTAIADLVNFRKDCIYFRDYTTSVNNLLQISDYNNQFYGDYANRLISDYCTNYMIKDPVSKRNIYVTCMYDLSSIMVDRFANNPYAPVAGEYNGIILRNAIKGTVNFTPVVSPSINQKEAIDELRVNYAVFQGDNCVMQSTYTSQKITTELSYTNNVMAVQTVMRAVRTACPKQRFALSSGGDLSNYAEAVNKVLEKFATNFAVLRFTYAADPLATAQKIFYAGIEVAFNPWAQTEIFDIYAINLANESNE